MITVREIVKQWLKDNKYDGLVDYEIECGCTLEDFEPCGEIGSECTAAYKHPHVDGGYIMKLEKYKGKTNE